jgi:hypothetical protein
MTERRRSDARLITVVETREFQQRAATRMSETERQAFITFIAGHPDDGAVMVGTGGLRKSRWGVGSRGKSGGGAGHLLLPQPYHAAVLANGLCQERAR